MSVEISQFVSSFGAVHGMVKALIDERDRQKAAVLQANLTKQITDAQIQLSQVLASAIDKDAALHALGQRVRELEAAQSEKARYRLAKMGAFGSFFAYELRPAAELVERPDEPPHFLCQPCFDAGNKSVLHVANHLAMCSLCKRNARIEPSPSSAPRRGSRGIDFNPREW